MGWEGDFSLNTFPYFLIFESQTLIDYLEGNQRLHQISQLGLSYSRDSFSQAVSSS